MKRQLIKTGITITLPIVILIVLFALQDTFIRLGSTRMSRMQNETTAASIADSIQILYNYKNRCDTGLQYTFLEFGAMGWNVSWKISEQHTAKGLKFGL